ncbi:fluoride efflux transporter CrcB [Bacillus sp. Marseille-Q1617]|uniref:fluoride efflux transporter CrcB n=1 Tax=Bacillus sp. Marseille-Q1617 TaxID=2736887 RepID=UPI00158C0E0C|nr:fluoride efflux transporter CrcB [Bacillus sp. Marseille-Q1617]
MQNYLLVGLAGAVGSLLRFALGASVHSHWQYHFPLGTLLVNLTGSFILGWMTTYLFQSKKMRPSVKAALGTGLIGSFTTFSTFSVETIELLQQAQWLFAFLYVILSMAGGLFMSGVGFKTGSILWKRENSVVEDND